MFIKCLKAGAIETNCYIACDKVTNSAVIIDPGADAQRIVSALADTGCAAAYILLTHGHADHMLAAHEVQERTGAKLGILKEELPLLNDPQKNVYTQLTQQPFEPFTPELLLEDGDVVQFGTSQLRVLHTPGHTKGSICFVGQDAIFTGDTLFREGAGRTDLPTGSAQEIEASVRRILSIEGDLQVLPGHGDFSTLSHERDFNPFYRG